LVLQKDQFNNHLNIGEECHIISRQPNGPRHREIVGFDYDDSSNLLLLCCNHHKMVDERVQEYKEETLAKIKADHEAWIKENLEPDHVATKEITMPPSALDELLDFVTTKHDVEMNLKTGRQVLESEEGLQIAFAETEKIKRRIYETVEKLSKKATEYKIIIKDNKTQICDLRFKGHTFLAQFNQAYINSATNSYLLFAVVKGLFDDNGYAAPFNECTIIEIIRLDFAYNERVEFGWRDQDNDKKFYHSVDITDIWLNKYFKTVLK